MKHVSHFKSLRFSPSPAANLYMCLPLLLQLHVLPHIVPTKSTSRLPRYSSAYTAHSTNNTKYVSHSTSYQFLLPLAANAHACSPFSARILYRASRSCSHTTIRPSSSPLCSKYVPHKQDLFCQSLRVLPLSPIANLKFTYILTSFDTRITLCLSVFQPVCVSGSER